MNIRGSRELKRAWAEFRGSDEVAGIHVGTLEAMEVLREALSSPVPGDHEAPATDRDVELGRFLDWLLYTKKNKGLAYELLRREGAINVGPRQYWATKQGRKRAIAWESHYTYPGTDSEIWDLIIVDEA